MMSHYSRATVSMFRRTCCPQILTQSAKHKPARSENSYWKAGWEAAGPCASNTPPQGRSSLNARSDKPTAITTLALPDKCVQHAPLRSAAMPSEICSHPLQALAQRRVNHCSLSRARWACPERRVSRLIAVVCISTSQVCECAAPDTSRGAVTVGVQSAIGLIALCAIALWLTEQIKAGLP